MRERDDELIARFKGGDAAAFEALFEHHAGTIYNFGYRMCRHPEDAQDVLQETFLAAFKGLKNFRETARLTTWLYKIASSACLKKRRKGKYAPARELSIEEFLPLSREGEGPPQIADWSRHPLTKLERKELQRLLAAAVAGLPEDYRVVLVLRDMEGLSAREVARILGISAAAVKSRLHRARLFVRERLSAYHETA